MVFRKPYGFLIKHFKLIHLILTGLYIYLAIKVNSILQYYQHFIVGTVSKLEAINYINSYYLIAVVLAIVICLVIYALMRYKKKPRALYLILIGFTLVVTFMIQYVYGGLNTIYMSILDSKSLLLYRDLLRILVLFQYLAVAVVLVRGLGFDIKKFNFVQDLEDLGMDVSDEEEVELSLGNNQAVGRKVRRNLRELKYYYFENKAFILIIVGIVLLVGLTSWVVKREVVDKEYQQNEVFSTNDFKFQVLNSFVTNRAYDNQKIVYDDTSFVIVRMALSSNGEKRQLNTSNLVLEVNNNSYACEKRYASRFIDLGYAYQDEKIGSGSTYLFIYRVDNKDLEKTMKLVYASYKTVILSPVKLDNEAESKKYKLGNAIDLSKSSFGIGSFKISSFDIKDKFSYPYQYEIDGQLYTNELSISSVRNVILNLKIDSTYPKGMNNYLFLEQYGTLKYKKNDMEYISSAFSDKTPGNYKEGLYLAVDKGVAEATNVWLEIKIRNQVYKYILK